VEITFGFLALAWAFFLRRYIWAHVAGWFGRFGLFDPRIRNARNKLWNTPKRAAYDGRQQLILALSSIIFLSLSVAVWTGVG